MKGYKVFNPDWTCRGFQYEVGKTYKHDGDISPCRAGFHFCRKAADCFNYYSFDPSNKVAEVEALGLVESDDTKSVTNEIHIVREIPWAEVLELVNTGKGCTGLSNSGDRNSGDWNSGNRNSGDRNSGNWNSGNRNSGNWNSGNWNSGNRNSGNWNSGDRNSGDWNSGDRNSGDWNSGDWNSGNWNSGDRNSGDRNSGDWNSGDRNSGDWNSGNWNSGDRNSGDWNSGNWNSGFFSTITPKFTLFEQPTDLTYDEIQNIKGIRILNWNYENNWWIYSVNMSEEEKKAHPEHETLGGYLKTVPFKDACALMWSNLTDEEKAEVQKIPNFDADIFKRITGIEV